MTPAFNRIGKQLIMPVGVVLPCPFCNVQISKGVYPCGFDMKIVQSSPIHVEAKVEITSVCSRTPQVKNEVGQEIEYAFGEFKYCPFCETNAYIKAGENKLVCGFSWQFLSIGPVNTRIQILSSCIKNQTIIQSSKNIPPHKCTCPKHTVLNFGCKCGGI